MALVLQPSTKTLSPRPPNTHRSTHRANQPSRYLQLAVAQALKRRVDLFASRLPGFHLLLLDLQVNLLAEHGDVPGSLDSDSHLLAHDRQHRDLDVVADHDALIRLPGQYQHCETASLLA